MLQKYDRDASKHVYDIVPGDESWIYAYELDSKHQLYRRSTFKQMIVCFSEKLDMSQSYH